MILEDDATIQQEYSENIDAVVSGAVEHGVDLVYLAYQNDGRNREPVDDIFLACNYTYWTVGYMISYDAAQKLAQNEEFYRMNIIPSDEYLPIVIGAFDKKARSSHDNKNNSVCEMDVNDDQLSGSAAMGADMLLDPRYPEVRLTCLTVQKPIIMPLFDPSQVSDTEHSELVTESEPAIIDDKQLLVITVATDGAEHFGYQTLARSLQYFAYNFVTLGLDKEWAGGSDFPSTGGGMKLHLMRDYLEKIDKGQMILFVDGYDTVIQLGPNELLERFKQFEADIVFGAELACWPSDELCTQYSKYYLTDTSKFKFLNSGTYMGSKSLKSGGCCVCSLLHIVVISSFLLFPLYRCWKHPCTFTKLQFK
jgi:hypothetical protein